MKTVEAFYEEIVNSPELRSELNDIKDRYALERFLRNHGCDAAAESFAGYVRSRTEGEIEDDEAEAAAGGIYYRPDGTSGELRPKQFSVS